MADIVENVLRAEAEKEQLFKTIEVPREIDSVVDLGNLLVEDINSFDKSSYHQSREQCLLDMARDSTQLLFNKIWELPSGKFITSTGLGIFVNITPPPPFNILTLRVRFKNLSDDP